MVRKLSVLFIALLFLSLPQAIFAQAVTGTIVGTVTDANGGVVVNAKVTIILTGQSAVYSFVTNESGNYTAPNLPSGLYSVTVAAPGFKKETRENISSPLTPRRASMSAWLLAASRSR